MPHQSSHFWKISGPKIGVNLASRIHPNSPETFQATRNPHLHDTLTHPLGGSELCGSTAGCSCRSQTLSVDKPDQPKIQSGQLLPGIHERKVFDTAHSRNLHTPRAYVITHHSHVITHHSLQCGIVHTHFRHIAIGQTTSHNLTMKRSFSKRLVAIFYHTTPV